MKLNRLETHDRLLHFKKDQALNVAQGAEDCLKRNELSLAMQDLSPYVYLFAHPRTSDDGLTKRMIWQPRLTKPNSQTNSYLFRAQSKTDVVEICWLLPPKEMWPQYKKGNVTEDEMVLWSIDQYCNNKENLDKSEKDDLSDSQVAGIYRIIRQSKRYDEMMNNTFKPKNEEESLPFSMV
jgi:hypothetical protein